MKPRYEHLAQVEIAKPCNESWDSMTGDEKRRHCDRCQLTVNNVAEMSADEAEHALSQGGHRCARLTLHDRLGVLTRDGWIPKLALAGALAVSAGCSHQAAVAAGETEPTHEGNLVDAAADVKDKTVECGNTILEGLGLKQKEVYVLYGSIASPAPISSPSSSPFYDPDEKYSLPNVEQQEAMTKKALSRKLNSMK